jgi:hypothetical protein
MQTERDTSQAQRSGVIAGQERRRREGKGGLTSSEERLPFLLAVCQSPRVYDPAATERYDHRRQVWEQEGYRCRRVARVSIESARSRHTTRAPRHHAHVATPPHAHAPEADCTVRSGLHKRVWGREHGLRSRHCRHQRILDLR